MTPLVHRFVTSRRVNCPPRGIPVGDGGPRHAGPGGGAVDDGETGRLRDLVHRAHEALAEVGRMQARCPAGVDRFDWSADLLDELARVALQVGDVAAEMTGGEDDDSFQADLPGARHRDRPPAQRGPGPAADPAPPARAPLLTTLPGVDTIGRLLVRCPDRQGIVAAVTSFLSAPARTSLARPARHRATRAAPSSSAPSSPCPGASAGCGRRSAPTSPAFGMTFRLRAPRSPSGWRSSSRSSTTACSTCCGGPPRRAPGRHRPGRVQPSRPRRGRRRPSGSRSPTSR